MGRSLLEWHGHRRIAVVTLPRRASRRIDRRLAGYRRAFADQGLSPKRGLVHEMDYAYRSAQSCSMILSKLT